MRLKIIAGNLVAVLLLGLVSYFVVGSDLEQQISNQVTAQITNDQALLDRSLRLLAVDFVNQVKQRATDADVKLVFTALDDEGRRTRAFDAAERSSAWLGDPARGTRGRPDIVLITDDSGKVLARNADRNRMYGMKLDTSLPAVAATLRDGEARHDVWKKVDEGKVLALAAVAVRSGEGTIVGSLVVGYDLSNGLAQSEGKALGGRDVAFVVDDKVYSSSFTNETVAKQLRAHLFGPIRVETGASMKGAISSTWTASLDGADYVGVLAPLPAADNSHVAYAVLTNRTRAIAMVPDATDTIIMLTIVFALVVIVYGFMMGNTIIKPIEELEEGVLAVINGNTDLRLDTSNTDYGGLAYRINQLLNVLTGVSEGDTEDAQGRVSSVHQEAWKDSAFSDGASGVAAAGGAGGPAAPDVIDDPAVAAKLAAEPEDAYYKRVFAEYVAAKKAAGESVANIPEDRFAQRLKGNEQALIKKHGCKAVRFQVQKNGVLQPVLIR